MWGLYHFGNCYKGAQRNYFSGDECFWGGVYVWEKYVCNCKFYLKVKVLPYVYSLLHLPPTPGYEWSTNSFKFAFFFYGLQINRKSHWGISDKRNRVAASEPSFSYRYIYPYSYSRCFSQHKLLYYIKISSSLQLQISLVFLWQRKISVQSQTKQYIRTYV